MAFGGLFLWSGVVKALDPQAFLFNVRSFQMLPDPWAAVLALGLPWVEIFAALAVIAGGWARSGLALLGAALLVFLGVLGYAWARGLDISCGCFGQTENKTNFPAQIFLDLVLLAIAAWLFWRDSRPR